MTAALRPVVLAFLAFLAGLLLALRSAPPPVPFLLLALIPLLLAALAPRPATRATVLLLVALGLGGAGLGAVAARTTAADCRPYLPDGGPVRLQGVLGASTRAPPGGWPRAPLLPVERATVRVAHDACVATVRVRVPDDAPPLPAGTEVAVEGDWVRHPPPVVATPWPRDPLYSGFVAAERLHVVRLPALGDHPLLTLRGRAETRLQELFGENAPLAVALLLGRREAMDPALRDRFARAGLVHLLAISGAHVAMFAGMLLLVGSLLRVSRTWIAAGVIGLVALYLGVIGAPGSALRAGVMVTLALAAGLLQRPTSTLSLTCAAAWLLLAHDPMGALDPGLQLSFAGVLAIVAAHRILRRAPRRWMRRTGTRWLLQSVAVSLTAFLATAPISAHHFGVLSPVSIPANLLAVPLTSLAVTGVAVAGVVSTVAEPVASLLAAGTGVALAAVDRVATLAAAVPHGHFAVARPPWAVWIAAGLASLAALRLGARLPRRTRLLVAPAAMAAVLLVAPAAVPLAPDALEVHFLDVGQGDAIAIRTPARRWILVDAGPRMEGFDAGERRVLPFLRAHGVRRVEALVLTHPHADHIGGAPALLREITVGRVIEPGLPVGTDLYLELLRLLEEKGVPWHAAREGQILRVDDVALEFLWPRPETLDAVEDANQISAVSRLRFRDFSLLLTGDVSAEVEHRLVESHGSGLRAQVLKAGHHGSHTSTSGEFLDVVEPELVVVSAGRRNRYGHPSPEVLERLQRSGVRVARTDREGTISLRVTEESGWTRAEP